MKTAREENRLEVALNKRADAKAKGAVYIRGSFFSGVKNGFYAPEGPVDDNGNSIEPIREILFMTYGKEEVAKEHIDENLWAEALLSRDTLKIAALLRDKGVPVREIQRVEMLKILRNPGRSLRIGFDDLRNFSESFKITYPEERVKDIVIKYIAGGTDYKLTLENSKATPEEKELVKYVFGF